MGWFLFRKSSGVGAESLIAHFNPRSCNSEDNVSMNRLLHGEEFWREERWAKSCEDVLQSLTLNFVVSTHHETLLVSRGGRLRV